MIQDLAFNPFETASAPMIGFQPGAFATVIPRPMPELSLQIYRFLIEAIREEDQLRGDRFVERLLMGPQEVWQRIDRSIRSLPNMWSITKVDDRFLPYLKWIVGWTSELDYITEDLDSTTLRRLIAASVPFWKVRGTEDALTEILRLTTGARLHVLNWFDLRWIVGETAIGEQHLGHDSWMLDFGAPDFNENRMNLRIVDDGTLNRRLVRNLVKLTRPAGERITIHYLGFLDQFTTDDDTSQWSESVGTVTPEVSSGVITIGPNNSIYASVPGADSWRNYVVSVTFRGPMLVFEVYRTADGDCYVIAVDLRLGGTVTVYKYVADTPTILVSIDTYEIPALNLDVDTWLNFDTESLYTLRVALTPEGDATRITVWLNGNYVCDVSDNAHDHGSIALAGVLAPSTTAHVTEIEMFFQPLEEDSIEIAPESVEEPS